MSRRLAVLGTALLIAVSACGADPAEKPEGEAGTASTTPDAETPASPEVETAPAVDLGAGPVGVTAQGDDAVWVVLSRDGQVVRIPAGATEPDLRVEVPGTPLRAVAAFDAVWVTSFHGERVLRIDPATGRVTDRVRTGAGPEGIAAGFGSLWLIEQDAGQLVRIDPATRRVVDRVDIGVGARLAFAGSDAVYVAHFRDDRVLRVDPRTLAVRRSPKLCSGPQGMAEAAGSVWVTCTFADEVVALDPDTLRPGARTAVPGLPDSVVAVGDRLLVLAEEGPRLVVLDATTGELVGEQVLGEESALYDNANLDLAVSAGEVWVSSFTADRAYHVPLPD